MPKKKKDKSKTPDEMPGLIVKHKKITKKEKKPQIIIKPENTAAKRLMWLSVALFSLVIIILWGWAMKVRLNNFSIQQTPENNLIKQGQQDWDALFNQTKESQQQTTTLSDVKKYLKQIIAAASSSTTSTKTATSTKTTTTSTKTRY